MNMKKHLIVGAVLVVLLTGVVAPSGAGMGTARAAVAAAPAAGVVQSAPAIFDKTRFVLHMGFAYFAFHHWIYKPFRAGDFAAGSSHRLLNLGKAALAMLFTLHELKKSYKIANASHSATLHALVAPLNALVNLAHRDHDRLKGCESSTQSSYDTDSYDVNDNGTLPAGTPTPAPTATATATANGTPTTGASCSYSDKDITSFNSAVDSFSRVASNNGVTIKDRSVPALPGLSS